MITATNNRAFRRPEFPPAALPPAAAAGLARRPVSPPGFFPPAVRHAAERRRHLRGVGECPAIAPYLLPGGSCTNVPPEPEETEETFVQTPYTNPEQLPAGWFSNTVTGQIVQLSPTQQALMDQVGISLNKDPAFQEQAAREAEAAGRARGLDTNCRVVASNGPGGTFYQVVCELNGVDGFGGKELLRPGGFEIAANEITYMTGAPTPQLAPDPQAAPYYDPYNTPETQLQFGQPITDLETLAAAVLDAAETTVLRSQWPDQSSGETTTRPTPRPTPYTIYDAPQAIIDPARVPQQTTYTTVPQEPGILVPQQTTIPVPQQTTVPSTTNVYLSSQPPYPNYTPAPARGSQLEVAGSQARPRLLPASAAPSDIEAWAKQVPIWAWAAAALAGYYFLQQKGRR